MKIVKLTEAQLKKVVSNVIKENEMTENYMFFGNLQQIHRQCEMLLKMDPKELDNIIKNGHDWADDHVSEAKNNMDQVFDFFMNETKGKDKEDVTAHMDSFSLNEEGQLDEKCWDGYKQVGSKIKNGKKVPNCVPVKGSTNEASSPSQQAAIAINMKKKGVEPKNESEEEIDESKNCPTDPAKWAASKAKAKAKFDVYPSAYANGFAAKDYKSKGGGWKKCKK